MSDRFRAKCIQLDRDSISPRRTVVDGIRFNLNAKLIKEIERVRSRQTPLVLSKSVLKSMREGMWRDRDNGFCTQLRFTTYYQERGDRPLIQTVFTWDGRTEMQIDRTLLQHPSLLLTLARTHRWLISQTLAQLQPKRAYNLAKLAIIALAIVATVGILLAVSGVVSWQLLLLLTAIAIVVLVPLGCYQYFSRDRPT